LLGTSVANPSDAVHVAAGFWSVSSQQTICGFFPRLSAQKSLHSLRAPLSIEREVNLLGLEHRMPNGLPGASARSTFIGASVAALGHDPHGGVVCSRNWRKSRWMGPRVANTSSLAGER
jgi:hypothetical protein